MAVICREMGAWTNSISITIYVAAAAAAAAAATSK